MFRVIRTLFAFAERTKMDPVYNGPTFECDKIMKDRISQVTLATKDPPNRNSNRIMIPCHFQSIKRKESKQENSETSSINSIFANLMQVITNTKSTEPHKPNSGC